MYKSLNVCVNAVVGDSFSCISFCLQDQPDVFTPLNLYHLAAILIKHGLLQLDDLYPHVITIPKRLLWAFFSVLLKMFSQY